MPDEVMVTTEPSTAAPSPSTVIVSPSVIVAVAAASVVPGSDPQAVSVTSATASTTSTGFLLMPALGLGGRKDELGALSSVPEAEDELRVVRHSLGRPRRVPDELGLDLVDARDAVHRLVDLLLD